VDVDVKTAPELAIRSGLVAVAFLGSETGVDNAFLSTGPSVLELGMAVGAIDAPPGSSLGSLGLALDGDDDGPVHMVLQASGMDVGGEVLYITYDPTDESFTMPTEPVADTSSGPHVSPSLAAGDGGACHIAWVDVSGSEPQILLRTLVPGLDPVTPSSIPATDPMTSPDLAFNDHQLSIVFVEEAREEPDAMAAIWVNSPPPDPQLQSPANDGWVTESDFDLSVQAGIDADGDPVLVRFVVEVPGSGVLEREYEVTPRFSVTDAEEGVYRWRAMTTDGYGVHMTPWWTFTVDMVPPGQPVFIPEPEYTPGTNNTLHWNATTDPGGSEVQYRVLAGQDTDFTPPYMATSDWITGTEYNFEDLPSTTIYYKLQARDQAGNTVDAVAIVSSTQDVENPKVFLSVDPALEAEEDQEVHFDASGSTDDNGIASYEWDFDSDGTIDSTVADTTWAYGEPGVYTVTIVIIDVAGNLNEFSDYTITILDVSPPNVQLAVDPGTEFDEDTTATFDASGSSDPSGIKAIRWYRDAETVPFAAGDEVSVNFPDPGVFEIEVEILDEWDNVANRTVMVTVLDVTAPTVLFTSLGPFDNRKVEFFSIHVNVTDNGQLASVVLFYKTQDAGLFSNVPMDLVSGSTTEWFKDELAPGGKGNATYYIIAIDEAGNENKTAYHRILVVGVEDPTPNGNGNGNGFDIGEYLWLIILLVVVAAAGGAGAVAMSRRKAKLAPAIASKTQAAAAPVAAAAAAPATPAAAVAAARDNVKEKSLCAIEEVYFILNDGRLVYAARSSTAPERSDQDIFAGMFTAIQDFIKDSMSQAGDLGSFDYGDNRIVIERGKVVTCAVSGQAHRGQLRRSDREVGRGQDQAGRYQRVRQANSGPNRWHRP
jgi:hypothetical protein